MRNLILSCLILLASTLVNAQSSKIRVVFVSNLDTIFSVVTFDKTRDFNINFVKGWETDLKTYLDSSKYEIYFDTIPKNVKKMSPIAFSFNKNNSKIKAWLPTLQEKKYDILLFLYSPPLVDSYYMFLSQSYGLLMGGNKAFSINQIRAYRISDFKYLEAMGLFHTKDFIKNLNKKDRITKEIDYVTEKDLNAAIEGVKELNRNIVIEKVAKKMNSDKFQEKYYNKK